MMTDDVRDGEAPHQIRVVVAALTHCTTVEQVADNLPDIEIISC